MENLNQNTVYSHYITTQKELTSILESNSEGACQFLLSQFKAENKKKIFPTTIKRLQSAAHFMDILVRSTEMIIQETNEDTCAINILEACVKAHDFFRTRQKCADNHIIFTKDPNFSNDTPKQTRKEIRSFFEELKINYPVLIIPYILLDNAVKYIPKNYYTIDNKCELVFVLSKEINDSMRISLTSLGPKVSEEELEQLCTKDYRATSATKHIDKGHGLGLYFVKEIIESYGWKLYLTSSNETITTIGGIEYSNFSVAIDINNNSTPNKICLEETKQLFLHEYNNILATLSESTEFFNNFIENEGGLNKFLDDHQNVSKDYLLDFVSNLKNAVRNYKLAVLCYVFKTNSDFINVGRNSTEIDIYNVLKESNQYYQSLFDNQGIKCLVQINVQNKFKDLFDYDTMLFSYTKLQINSSDWLGDIFFLIYSLIYSVTDNKDQYGALIQLTPQQYSISVDINIPLKNTSVFSKNSYAETARNLILFVLNKYRNIQVESNSIDQLGHYILKFIL